MLLMDAYVAESPTAEISVSRLPTMQHRVCVRVEERGSVMGMTLSHVQARELAKAMLADADRCEAFVTARAA